MAYRPRSTMYLSYSRKRPAVQQLLPPFNKRGPGQWKKKALYRKPRSTQPSLRIYTMPLSGAQVANGSVYHLNSFALGLGNNQRKSEIDIVKSVYVRLWVELNGNSQYYNRTFKFRWYLVQDMVPGDAMPTFGDIFKNDSNNNVGVEYIPDDSHNRFQVKRQGTIVCTCNGQTIGTSAHLGAPAYPNGFVRKFCKNVNCKGVFDRDTSTGSMGSLKSGALYLAVYGEAAYTIGGNITIYHA